jgi:hypothetical protein
MASPAPALRCRQIGEADIAAIATLLARGFPKRSRQFWLQALGQLRRRESPSPLPKYGYLLENGGVPVGVLLLIGTTMQAGDAVVTRCNLSSWYAAPEFRAYASLLVSQAVRHKDITYLNVSPGLHTLPMIEAQGFLRYCDGIFVAMPIFNVFFGDRAKVLDARQQPTVAFDPGEHKILLEHAALGCVSLWCVTSERAYPFVFRQRVVEAIVPCVQMVYCRDITDFVRFAGPIGRFFALHGRLFVLVDANGPVPGLVGRFFPGKMPKYFKGPQRPRLGDLAYTEIPVLGV